MGRRGVLKSAICIVVFGAAASGCASAPRRAEPACPVSAPGGPAMEMTRAYELLRCGRLEEAISAFSTVANADPADKRARMELAYARQAAGSFDAAADDFELVAREPGEFQEQAQAALKALREEGRILGVEVMVVCPGNIKTDIFSSGSVTNAPKELVFKDSALSSMSVEKAASIIVVAIPKNRGLIVFPGYAQIMCFLERVHPALLAPLHRIVLKNFRLHRGKMEP